jgi:hypothetical protein
MQALKGIFGNNTVKQEKKAEQKNSPLSSAIGRSVMEEKNVKNILLSDSIPTESESLVSLTNTPMKIGDKKEFEKFDSIRIRLSNSGEEFDLNSSGSEKENKF